MFQFARNSLVRARLSLWYPVKAATSATGANTNRTLWRSSQGVSLINFVQPSHCGTVVPAEKGGQLLLWRASVLTAAAAVLGFTAGASVADALQILPAKCTADLPFSGTTTKSKQVLEEFQAWAGANLGALQIANWVEVRKPPWERPHRSEFAPP